MKSVIKYLGLLLSIMMYSQKNDVNYIVDFVTTEQGLSHNFSTSILSDDLNIKWIGTENGITKYNGFDFEYIKPGERYKELLNENINNTLLKSNFIPDKYLSYFERQIFYYNFLYIPKSRN